MIRPAVALLALAAAMPVASSGATAQGGPRSLPDAMLGTWGYEARSCSEETDDGRVRVEPRSIEFFTSSCRFSGYQRDRAGTVTASGRCRGEGETEVTRESVRFRQVSPEQLQITWQGSQHIYLRCSQNLPVR